MAVKFEMICTGQYRLDVTGYTCPHPQMYTKKALEKLDSGELLMLIFDNPSSGESIISMLDSAGNELFHRSDESGTFTWHIRKG